MICVAPYVLPGNGSTSDLSTYSPRVTRTYSHTVNPILSLWRQETWNLERVSFEPTWFGRARATQWPAVTTCHWLTRLPPHLMILFVTYEQNISSVMKEIKLGSLTSLFIAQALKYGHWAPACSNPDVCLPWESTEACLIPTDNSTLCDGTTNRGNSASERLGSRNKHLGGFVSTWDH